ncbi:alpha/beta hydrolase [Plantactinospora sp. GCM10030261]|uniref:alpha/beta hydrolase n=1 Tax=Plantactinospora sp. GCM10030261 TaxID=3273420 RepID=UPI003613FCCE
MALDPYTEGVRRLMSAAYPDVGGAVTDAAEARRRHRRARFPSGPDLGDVRDIVIPGAPDIPARVYRPRTAGPNLPVVVYLHGGGFVLCDLDSHDGICRILSDGTPAIVVSVDYRRAPEHPYPAAVDDAYAALRWVYADGAAALGGDPDRIAVAGDSAGGNLATVCCLRSRDEDGPPVRFQLLVYPVTDCLADWPDDPRGQLMTSRHMRWYVDQYLTDRTHGEQAYASPLRAESLAGLPPAFVLTVEHDPLRPEGEAYAARLAAAGVAVRTHRVAGLFHGAFGLGAVLPAARRSEELACEALRTALTGPGSAGPGSAGPAPASTRSAAVTTSDMSIDPRVGRRSEVAR